jgi:hypothetical protein
LPPEYYLPMILKFDIIYENQRDQREKTEKFPHARYNLHSSTETNY